MQTKLYKDDNIYKSAVAVKNPEIKAAGTEP
jgi:hypothetical protein